MNNSIFEVKNPDFGGGWATSTTFSILFLLLDVHVFNCCRFSNDGFVLFSIVNIVLCLADNKSLHNRISKPVIVSFGGVTQYTHI